MRLILARVLRRMADRLDGPETLTLYVPTSVNTTSYTIDLISKETR
jgi:hypothetical protein